MKDICFLSMLYPNTNTEYDKYITKHRSQNISFIQNELIKGFEENLGNKVHIINKLLVPLYKKGFTKPLIKAGTFEHSNDLKKKDIIFPFINIPFLHSISLFLGARKYIKRWIVAKSGDKYLIAYSLTTYSLKAMKYAKKKNPNIKTCIIVPDIPQFTYRNSKDIIIKIKNYIAMQIIDNKIRNLSKHVDAFCFFSEHMKEFIPAKRYCVFEGLSTEGFTNVDSIRYYSEQEKIIVYAGGLHANYGVKLLLDAFCILKQPNYRLILCGRGSLEEEIIRQTADDPRIIFLGEIPRTELLSIEKGADLLINPRVNCGIFTRYSFPSKNLEYLSSGTPMIGYRLDGIPDEYDDYINCFEKPTPESLAKKIEEVLETNFVNTIVRANNAMEYVTKNKNAISQAKMIIKTMD